MALDTSLTGLSAHLGLHYECGPTEVEGEEDE